MEKRSRKSLLATVLGIVLAIILIILLTIVCNYVNTGIVHSQTTQGTDGSFYVFHTKASKIYVDFLENLDEEKYEIVDISRTDGTWYVTYKVTE